MATSDPLESSDGSLQGFTKDGLAEFDTQFHKLVDDGKLANMVTLIARYGEIVHATPTVCTTSQQLSPSPSPSRPPASIASHPC
jgi:hypothetical protein